MPIATARFNATTGVGIQLLPSANAIDTLTGVMAALDRLKPAFPPGLEYQLAFDNVGVVRESFIEVLKTLGEAIALVLIGTPIYFFYRKRHSVGAAG
jgi:multidrug efflux pump subunit AcrB